MPACAQEWILKPSAGYEVQTVSGKACHSELPCQLLASAGSKTPSTAGFGALLRTLDAARLRGRTVRFHALVRVQTSGDNHGRLALRTARHSDPETPDALFDHLDYREIRGSGWLPVEIVRAIEPDVESLSIGVLLMGKGRLWLDEISLSVLAGSAVETSSPALPAPTAAEQADAINTAFGFADHYLHDLPNFLCTLLVNRSENHNNAGWKPRDLLQMQLGFADKRERYKLVAVNNRPAHDTYQTLGGTFSEGDFGSILGEILRPHAARFYWDRWATLRGRVVAVYRYQLPRKNSEYRLEFSADGGHARSAISPHHGTVWLERGTGRVLRIEQVADPPASSPLRIATTNIDYDWSEIGGQSYLLPLTSEVTIGTNDFQTVNAVRFLDYKRFGAETQITFDQP